jgi:hypothetical protein
MPATPFATKSIACWIGGAATRLVNPAKGYGCNLREALFTPIEALAHGHTDTMQGNGPSQAGEYMSNQLKSTSASALTHGSA